MKFEAPTSPYFSPQITEMENLEELVNLESLDISHNRLKKIQGIQNLVNLRDGL